MDVQPLTPSPWLSIWFRPRQTIREIVETDPTRYVLLLAMAVGIGRALDRGSDRSAGDTMSFTLFIILAVVLGPIGGILSLYISGALLRWTGSWLGGKASSEEVRAAIA